MDVEFDFGGSVALVTGASGALGSAVCEAFRAAGATVAATDVRPPEEGLLDTGGDVHFYEGDLTDEESAEAVVSSVVGDHGRIDALAAIAGTWQGGDPVDETPVDRFDLLFDVNLKTAFLATKHALPHLRETEGSVVTVSARSSLEGGSGDSLYRASKAGVRLLTESVAEENRGTVRANAIMPSVLNTPMNREMMPDADHDAWVDPAEAAAVVLFLCSDAAGVTSGAAVPVYGDA
jgi:NAD(P)-dependent dehydrogenase (short-subunit alcohol dehydrogenase family)